MKAIGTSALVTPPSPCYVKTLKITPVECLTPNQLFSGLWRKCSQRCRSHCYNPNSGGLRRNLFQRLDPHSGLHDLPEICGRVYWSFRGIIFGRINSWWLLHKFVAYVTQFWRISAPITMGTGSMYYPLYRCVIPLLYYVIYEGSLRPILS